MITPKWMKTSSAESALPIIGAGHTCRVGKDEMAGILCREFGFERVSFADPLYEECRNLPQWCEVGGDGVWVYSRPKHTLRDGKPFKAVSLPRPDFLTDKLLHEGMREKHPSLLQWWGTDVRRMHFSENYWVQQVVDKVKANPTGRFISPDCRFPNEAKAIKDLGGSVVKILRPDRPLDRDPNHPSEAALNEYTEWDYIFCNTGTLDEYHALVRDWAKKTLG